jgi:hypothetical protein
MLTNDRLSNQARNWTSQPHKTGDLFRDAKVEQEGCSISRRSRGSDGRPGLGQGWNYPNSTVQAICAPAIDILRLIRSSVDRRRRFPFASALEPSDGPLVVLLVGLAGSEATRESFGSRPDLLRAPGHGIWVVGSGSTAGMVISESRGGGRKESAATI